jgi:hypothetical protein
MGEIIGTGFDQSPNRDLLKSGSATGQMVNRNTGGSVIVKPYIRRRKRAGTTVNTGKTGIPNIA